MPTVPYKPDVRALSAQVKSAVVFPCDFPCLVMAAWIGFLVNCPIQWMVIMQRRLIWTLALLVAVVVGFWVGYCYHGASPSRKFVAGSSLKGTTCFPVYDLDPFTMSERILLCIPIPDSLGLESKFRMLATQLSELVFGNLPMDVLSIENRSGRLVARVNLQETKDKQGIGQWYSRFQGSTGGARNQHALTESFLQRHYDGEWIDGIEFYYNGEPFTQEWDHINLSGQIDRVSHTIPSYIRTILLQLPLFLH